MSVRSVRYGGGVWRQMKESQVILEEQVAQLNAKLESKIQQLDAAQLEKNAALKRVSELEKTVRKHKRSFSTLEETLLAETSRSKCFCLEAKTFQNKCDQLEHKCSELQEEVCGLRESLGRQVNEMNRSILEIEEGKRETTRLRDMLYDVQEQVELLQQQNGKQQTALTVLEGSLAAKTRQLASLTKGRDELARKLSHVRNGIRSAPSNCQGKQQTPKDTRFAGEPKPSKLKKAESSDSADPTTPQYYGRALQHSRALLEQEKQRSAELTARIHELELDRRELLARFRAAAAARRRAEQRL